MPKHPGHPQTLTPIRTRERSLELIQAKREATAYRRKVLAALREKQITLREILDLHDPRLSGVLTVLQVLTAIRDWKWATRQCRLLGIDPKKRIGLLGPAQEHRLVGRADTR